MKPLQQPTEDADALQELGRASVQIVHDLKNQLNGLKLYATFLRKRHERGGERQPDELETVGKIAAGLERAAEDMAVLVRFGRPVELRRAPRVDLAQLLRAAAGPASEPEVAAGEFRGEFDAEALSAALRDITGVLHGTESGGGAGARPLSLRREERGGAAAAVVEWRGLKVAAGGPSPFETFAGSNGLRLAQAARVVRAHGGAVEHGAGTVSVRLPLNA
jgi:signal transduction histidine kinase